MRTFEEEFGKTLKLFSWFKGLNVNSDDGIKMWIQHLAASKTGEEGRFDLNINLFI